ncbi:tetratricopeptide repeat protein [Treponema sp. R8-4-B8]
MKNLFSTVTAEQAAAQTAVQTEPKTAEEYFKRGIVYYQQKEHDKAIADFETVLQLNPDLTKVKNALKRAKKKMGSS